jgi:hypothetical protein
VVFIPELLYISLLAHTLLLFMEIFMHKWFLYTKLIVNYYFLEETISYLSIMLFNQLPLINTCLIPNLFSTLWLLFNHSVQWVRMAQATMGYLGGAISSEHLLDNSPNTWGKQVGS